LVGTTAIFPGFGFAWYNKASCLFLESLMSSLCIRTYKYMVFNGRENVKENLL
jgi:hypothetical protein